MTRAARRSGWRPPPLGGGGVGLAGPLVALLREEARAARRRSRAAGSKLDPPSGDGIYGHRRGKPLVLAVLGDSTAVGLGRASAPPRRPASWSPPP